MICGFMFIKSNLMSSRVVSDLFILLECIACIKLLYNIYDIYLLLPEKITSKYRKANV